MFVNYKYMININFYMYFIVFLTYRKRFENQISGNSQFIF